MDVEREMVAHCSPDELYAHVVDLASYPAWMDLVHEAVPDAASDVAAPAWDVELRAQLGPLARSKRLRMERAVDERPSRVVFRRRELDGRQHAEWRLEAEIEPVSGAARQPSTQLTMRLHYGGRLWTGGILERVLEERVERGSAALRRLVEPR